MIRAGGQAKLFDTGTVLPSGFIYRPDFLSLAEEADLLSYIEDLPLEQAVGNEGYLAKRRILNFGWSYDFNSGKLVKGPPLPVWLQPTARKVAKWVDISPERVVEALISEYEPGTAIGWHRDNESFEHVVGVSLSGWCRMRLRPVRGQRMTKEVTSLGQRTLYHCPR